MYFHWIILNAIKLLQVYLIVILHNVDIESELITVLHRLYSGMQMQKDTKTWTMEKMGDPDIIRLRLVNYLCLFGCINSQLMSFICILGVWRVYILGFFWNFLVMWAENTLIAMKIRFISVWEIIPYSLFVDMFAVLTWVTSSTKKIKLILLVNFIYILRSFKAHGVRKWYICWFMFEFQTERKKNSSSQT